MSAFFVSVCFKNTNLIVVEISLQGDEFPTSWDNWSEEGERKRQREHDRLLQQHLSVKPSYRQTKPYPYMEYELNWGKISSYFDPGREIRPLLLSIKMNSDLT